MMHKIQVGHIKMLGYTAILLSIVLWLLLVWNAPLFEGMNKLDPRLSFIMLVLPSCLYAAGLAMSKVLLLLIAFVWSIPFSLFMLFSDDIYILYGLVSIVYYICILMCRLKKMKYL